MCKFLFVFLFVICLLMSCTSCSTVAVVPSKNCDQLERGTPRLEQIYEQCVNGRNYCEQLPRGNPKLEQIYEECLEREKVEEVILDSMKKKEEPVRRGPF